MRHQTRIYFLYTALPPDLAVGVGPEALLTVGGVLWTSLANIASQCIKKIYSV